jgi:sugar-specific transcriptional regulator TrmB
MRVKYFLLSVLTFFNVSIIGAQNSCPLGYELRNIKCINSPSMTQQCIPANYSCNSCWQVEWQRCNGTGKGYENASNYEDALKIATDRKKDMESCKGSMGLDYNNYRIFIAGGEYCTNSNSNSQTSNGRSNSNSNGIINNQSNNNSANNQATISNSQNQGRSGDLQLQAEIQFFYVQHHNAEEKLEDIKKKDPANAKTYETTYRTKLQQLLNSVKNEAAKNNPSIETLKAFRKQLDQLMEQMVTAETMALNNSNSQKTQQQYQNQANSYSNQAQNTNQSAISQQMNLDLAKTNAIMAGNSQQISDLSKQQVQLTEKANQQLINSSVNLANAINQYSAYAAQRKQRQELYKSKKENNFHLGITELLNNRIGSLYFESYDEIQKDKMTLGENDPSDWTYKIERAQGTGKLFSDEIKTNKYDFLVSQVANSISKDPFYSIETMELEGIAFIQPGKYTSLGDGLFYGNDNKGKKYYDKKMKEFIDEKLKPEEALTLGFLHYNPISSKYTLGKPADYDMAFKILRFIPDHNGHPYFTKHAFFLMGILKKAEAISKNDSTILKEAIEYFDKAFSINNKDFTAGFSQYIILKDYSYLFLDEDYYWSLQLCIMEELVAAFEIRAKYDKSAYIEAVDKYFEFGNQYFNRK